MALFDDKTTREATSRHQSDFAFSKALSKGFTEELHRLLLKRSQRLLPFDEVKEKLELWYVEDLGLRSVPIDSIIGSQGRYRSFTRHFMPLEENLRTRWKKVDDAVTAGKDLPPVELYKVCDTYFVKDGHHRISVAKAKNKHTIQAHVYAYNCDISLDDKTDMERIAILETYHQFLKETGLKKSRNPELHLTVLGGYSIIMEHIQRHKYYLEKNEQRQVCLQEAAVSWFDGIYQPMVRLIKTNGILEQFPHRTEADFYIWISKYKNSLFEDGFAPTEMQNVILNYKNFFSNPVRKAWGRIRRILGLVKY